MGVTSHKHPLLGRWAPNLVLQTDGEHSTVADLLSDGRGLLVDRSGRPELRNLAGGWDDRIRLVAAKYDNRSDNLDAMLVRPDGYVAWAVASGDWDDDSEKSLLAALGKWFGSPK
jgi:hypothetical protein